MFLLCHLYKFVREKRFPAVQTGMESVRPVVAGKPIDITNDN